MQVKDKHIYEYLLYLKNQKNSSQNTILSYGRDLVEFYDYVAKHQPEILEAEQNIEKEDLGDIIFGSKSYAKSLDGVASYLGNIKQTPKEAIVNIEQALNNFYRSRLQSIESNHVSLSEIRKRRHILSEMRRATMSNETVYNVSMIMESVASC